MTHLSLALLTSVSFVALACGGEPQGSGGSGTTTRESVESPSAEECEGDGWPGPWTACPQADWVRQVAERAGYRVTGETGSALVAQGKGRSFYIWAAPAAGQDLDDGPTARKGPLGEVEGVTVYGDERLWRWWTANGFVLWLKAGPYSTSQIPRLKEMNSLVQESTAVPPPR
jgi:hypothetical protein